ncbi:MAG: hypothetical protein JWL70_2407 [Acidimicrobiia bacterium]|nr:hypothetical protein [Acidimicrobiia bacterium]
MAERDYGLIYDTVSWELPLDADRSTAVGSCQVFRANPDPQPGAPHALARTDVMAFYMRSFADGGGENGLHSHDDDAVWFVVNGHATFYASGEELLGELDSNDGVLVPAGKSYRFVCTGPTTLARVAARVEHKAV